LAYFLSKKKKKERKKGEIVGCNEIKLNAKRTYKGSVG
jgi:hypothetical protein